jgi:protoporphyrinogen oxidase
MRRAEFGEVLRGSMTPNTPNTYYTSEMRYPKIGGFKSFIKPLILASDVEFEKKVIKIDTNTHTVSFSDGSNVVYNQLISSMPMPELVKCIKDAPKEVKDAASSLYATSIDLISIGFNKDVIKDLWFYIYDEDIFASRAYSPSMKSQDNVPNGCSSLQFEIYSSRHTTERHTKQQLIDNSLYALEKLNIANKHDILFTHHKKIKYGNVVFDIGMEDRRSIIREFLDSVGVLSIGRFGEWDYLWSNQAMMSGKRAIEHILDGK